MTKKISSILLGLAGFIVYSGVQAGCSSNLCSVSHNWDEYSMKHAGWSGGLQYSYSNADILRSGSNRIAADTTADEVENLRTINRQAVINMDYAHIENWGISLHVPYIMRDHDHTLGPYSGATPAGYESFHASALGDAKIIGRYRWHTSEAGLPGIGVKAGLKLNTGKKDVSYAQTGTVPGEAAMQPGNGSTDLILGFFWFRETMPGDWSWFAQGTLQSPVKSSTTFRPGRQVNLDGGVRYTLDEKSSGLLQINLQWNGTDSGTAAARTPSGAASSGGKIVAVSPGMSYAFTPALQIYGLLQLPVYQYVNGEQLTAEYTVSAGANYRF